MSEHISDPNTEYLSRHPNAETNPDRANAAAYSRKKIDDLIAIAQSSGAHEMESLLLKKADEYENTAVAEYDLVGNAEKEIMDRLSDAVVALTTGEVKEVSIYRNEDRLPSIEDLKHEEGMEAANRVARIIKDRILDIMKARKIISFNTSDAGSHREGLPASRLINLFSVNDEGKEGFISVYDTFAPNIILGMYQFCIDGKPTEYYHVNVYHRDLLPAEQLHEIAKYTQQDTHS